MEKSLGAFIKTYRIKKKLTQTELATQLGVNVSFVCKIEKSEKTLSKSHFNKLSEILNAKLTDINNQWVSDKIIEIISNEENKDEIIKMTILKLTENSKN
ncbi:helix-turn-helix domain-containing protein [Empedobacter brevis]